MNTKIKDGAIPVDPEVLQDAGITTETALAVRSTGEGTLVVEAVADPLEDLIDEYANRPLSEDEFSESLRRMDELVDERG